MTHRSTGHARGFRRMVLALLLAVVGGVALAGTASAHTDLISSDPAEGATLTAPPAVVTLIFAAPMVDLGATVVITGPDGTPYPTGAPVVDGAEVRTEVPDLGPNGTYTIGYRVLSGDGHPVDGEIPFQLEVPPAPEPAPAPAPAPTPSSSPAPSSPISSPAPSSPSSNSTPTTAAVTSTAAGGSSGTSGWVWVGAAVVVVLVAGAAVALVRQRRGSSAS